MKLIASEPVTILSDRVDRRYIPHMDLTDGRGQNREKSSFCFAQREVNLTGSAKLLRCNQLIYVTRLLELTRNSNRLTGVNLAGFVIFSKHAEVLIAGMGVRAG